jgi:hypothetical protein
LAANNIAFAESEALLPDEDSNAANDNTWKKLQKTYEWRLNQIHDGNIEVRTDTNLKELEENYTEEDMISMLELPNEAAKYDIYNVLIGTSIDK